VRWDALPIAIGDGRYANTRQVKDKLRQPIENGTGIDLVLAIGPIVVMRASQNDQLFRASADNRDRIQKLRVGIEEGKALVKYEY
jgi:hypothetical protein